MPPRLKIGTFKDKPINWLKLSLSCVLKATRSTSVLKVGANTNSPDSVAPICIGSPGVASTISVLNPEYPVPIEPLSESEG